MVLAGLYVDSPLVVLFYTSVLSVYSVENVFWGKAEGFCPRMTRIYTEKSWKEVFG